MRSSHRTSKQELMELDGQCLENVNGFNQKLKLVHAETKSHCLTFGHGLNVFALPVTQTL